MNFISMLNAFLFHVKDLFPTHRDLTVNHQRSWSTFAAIQHWLYSTDKTDMPETNSRRYHETKSLWVNPCSLPEYEFHQQSMLNAILSHFKEFFLTNGKMHSTDLTFASLQFLQSNTDCINSTDITDIPQTNSRRYQWNKIALGSSNLFLRLTSLHAVWEQVCLSMTVPLTKNAFAEKNVQIYL